MTVENDNSQVGEGLRLGGGEDDAEGLVVFDKEHQRLEAPHTAGNAYGGA